MEELQQGGLNPFNISHACDIKELKKPEGFQGSFHTDYEEIFTANGKLNVILELTDSAESGIDIARKALKKGKYLVTANKRMIAENLAELIELQRFYFGKLLYEASVCGSIPIIRILEEFYRQLPISSLQMICNGTTNYILSRMFLHQESYQSALRSAQEQGYAESQPDNDINGTDSACKLAITLAHAYGVIVQPRSIITSGIGAISKAEMDFATENNMRIKLFAHTEVEKNEVTGFVLPHFIKPDHPLYRIEYEDNSVVIESEKLGRQQFSGKGAGKTPTANTVIADIDAVMSGKSYNYPKSNSGYTFKTSKGQNVYARGSAAILGALPWKSVSGQHSKNGDEVFTGIIELNDCDIRKYPMLSTCFLAALPDDYLP